MALLPSRKLHKHPSREKPCPYVVLSWSSCQLITDEFNVHAVEPELLYEILSMVLCTPDAQLVDLTVDAFQPLVHLEHFVEHCLGVVLQAEQLGVAWAQHTAIQLDLARPQALSF